jgi:hypothetical protein
MLEYKYRASSTDDAPLSIMQPIPVAHQKQILSMIDAGHSGGKIASATGYNISTISRLCSQHCSHLPKSAGGHPPKLSSINIHHTVHLIGSGKAGTAVVVAKTLSNITNQPLSAQTVCHSLKKAGMKAVVKKKKPFLRQRPRKARMDFALTHQHWTVED